jgi:hypothetical protein
MAEEVLPVPFLPSAHAVVILKAVLSLPALATISIANHVPRGLLRARFSDTPYAHTVFMLVRNAVFLIGTNTIVSGDVLDISMSRTTATEIGQQTTNTLEETSWSAVS